MTLAPWLLRQLTLLRQHRAHALLLSGPAGLGHYALGLELARTWLCEQPTAQGSCGQCASCHAIDVRTHADLFVLMPEVVALEWGWPLDPRTQDKIDKKELKPSKFIRVDPVREAVAFTQTTAARGQGRVVLVYPADRLNTESANALLKTLEEPPGHTRFILATEAVHGVLPTIRSRCVNQVLQWPSAGEALAWMAMQRPEAPAALLELALRAAGQRPDLAIDWIDAGLTAADWVALPKAIAAGQGERMQSWTAQRQLDVLQKLCHDLMAVSARATPRYFAASDLPPCPPMTQLNAWWKDLLAAAKTVEHPFSPALMAESWWLRAQQALTVHSRP